MSRLSLRSWLPIVVCLLLASSGLYGQAINATLTGIVRDATAAVVPDASVTLKNVATGDTRKTATNTDGYFSFVAIPTGQYTLTVEKPGFSKWERTGVTFTGADHLTASDIVLQVAGTTETVSVGALVELITPVDSGEKSTVLTTRQLQDFSVVGRSAAEFIKVMPGFAINNGVQNRASFTGEIIGINGNGDGGSQSALNAAFSAQGSPTNYIDITADGAHVSDPGCNCATPVNPNTDMIQEFKVMTNAFSAENSKGPMVINTVAKAGTRDFHGEAYLYARHYSMNANDWFNKSQSVLRPNNKYFFPGGNVSGPVLFPGTDFNRKREKLFFFSGFEYYYQTLDTGVLSATVPTAAMRNGDFSPAELAKLGTKTSTGGAPNQITDLVTCPGGVCPKSAWYPGAQSLLNLYPMPNKDPNQTGGYNYVDTAIFNQNSWQSMSRIDYSISDNTKLFVRANLQNELQQFPVSLWWRNGGSVPYPTPIDGKNTSKSVSTSLTHVFSPSLTNEVVFGYTFIDFPNYIHDQSKVDRNKLGFTFKGVYKNGISQIPALGSYGGSELATIFNPGGFEAGHGNLYATKHLLSFADNLSKVVKTHTLKFGFFSEYLINNQPANNQTNGWGIFAPWAGNTSGNSYADLLLGRPNSYSETNLNPLHNEAYRTYEFYAQDSWKVSPRVTLDLGLRVQHLGAWYDREGLGFAVWDPASYDPRVTDPNAYTGVLWIKRNPSIRNAGFGTPALFYTPRFGIAWDVFGTAKTVLRGGWGMFRYNSAQSTQGMDVPWGVLSYSGSAGNTLQSFEAVVPSYSISGIGLVDRNDSNRPMTTNYNFTISQRLPGANQLEIAYVGSHSEHMGATGSAQGGYNKNINLVPYGALWSVADPNNIGSNYDNYRPMKNYQDINISQYTGYSNYNSLQTTISRQRGRWNYQFNYTWSKVLALVDHWDGFNIDNNYGIAPYDRTHIFNGAYSVELPDAFTGAGANRLAKGLANGWQISGITQIQSGVDLGANQANLGINVTGVPSGTVNPYVREYILGTRSMNLNPIITCDPTKGLAPHQYINGACFAMPVRGQNGPTRIPPIRGPWFTNSDLSVFKNFKWTETRRFQFRFSAYNFLNHPITSFRDGNDNNLKLTYDYSHPTVLSNSRFGYADYKYGHRVIQLALKFYF